MFEALLIIVAVVVILGFAIIAKWLNPERDDD